jgi:large subunit ribosomal protein L30
MPRSTDKTKRAAGATAPGRARATKVVKRAAATARPRAKKAEATAAAPAQAAEGRQPRTAHAVPAGGGSRQQQRAARTWTKTVTIEQYGSGIQCPVRQKRILRALGLRRPRQTVVRPDNPAIRGMVAAITHLVRIVDGREGRDGQ